MHRAISATVAPLALGVCAALASSCVRSAPAPLPRPAPTKASTALAPPPRLPPWTYWESVPVPALTAGPPVELPAAENLLVLSGGATSRWAAAPSTVRDQVVSHGFVVTPPARPVISLARFYADLRAARIPSLITMDALFFLAHLAVQRALADVDTVVRRPALSALLHRLDARLGAEARGARPDLELGYLHARGVVSVALALADPAYIPAKDISGLVDEERSRVIAHTGVGISPWLGVPLDYSSMIVRGGADNQEDLAGWSRAAAWLAGAALALEGRGEGGVLAHVDVATARAHARAAVLLSRLVDPAVDAQAAESWERWERTSELLSGEPDDVTPKEVTAAAAKLGLDLVDAKWLANIVQVDKLRHAAARLRVARIDDGAGATRAPATGMAATDRIGLLAPNFRMIAPRSTPDGTLLQELVFPMVGRLAAGADPPPTARDALRALPAALDVAAWLGSRQARAALHDQGDDAYALYDENLERARNSRPGAAAAARHRDPYASTVDALETWIAPSGGDGFHAGAGRPEWGKRKAEVALCAWTELRHDAMPFVRGAVGDLGQTPADGSVDPEAPVLVEAHPEAIAKLLGVVRQVSRALAAEHALDPASAGVRALDLAGNALATALDAATTEARDEALSPPAAAALAALPAKLDVLEASLAPSRGGEVPIVVDVHTDERSARALAEGLGRVQEAWMLVREPGRAGRLRLVLGASVPHDEIVQPASRRLADAAWRANLDASGDPPADALARAYLAGTP